MPVFSLLARVSNTNPEELQQLVAMMEAQTESDWELVLVVGERQLTDRELVADIVALHPRIRSELRPDSESLPQSVTALLPSLGTWSGMIGVRDKLLPQTLATITAAVALTPTVRVVYTDEEASNRWGIISRRFDKGSFNALRLRHQEYLRDLALVQTAWLQELGGYARETTQCPTHECYLRTFETLGVGAFLHIPGRLFQRYRDHRLNLGIEAGYDPEAIRRHLLRTKLPATLQTDAGTAVLRYKWPNAPVMTLLVLLDDSPGASEARLLTVGRTCQYRPMQVRALYRGTDSAMASRLAGLCSGLRYDFTSLDPAGVLPAQLNQELQRCDTPYAAILQGTPCSPNWLEALVDLLPLGYAVVGGRIMDPVRLRAPGMLGYRFAGWDWNTRGRFNELAVPHQVSAWGAFATCYDLDVFRAQGGFDPILPTLYGMDYAMRADTAGARLAWTPHARILLDSEPPAPVAAELSTFLTRWVGWSDPFDLFQLPGMLTDNQLLTVEGSPLFTVEGFPIYIADLTA